MSEIARNPYFAEQYVVDGGLPGRTRDLWAGWRVTPDGASYVYASVTTLSGLYLVDGLR